MDNAPINLPAPVAALLALAGQFQTLTWERDCEVRKSSPIAKVTKRVVAQVRIGVNYDHIGAVIAKRENGDLPAENAGLPWGHWLVFPHLIGHKGCHYLRCTVANTNVPMRVAYFANGKEITREEAMVYCTAKEFREKDSLDVFTVKVESITHVNGVPV